MCGIAICISKNPEVRQQFANTAKQLLNHRGPDGNGIWVDEDIALVHTRLSILDLSDSGSQPMLSSNGQFVITFNGEVYNHLELRKKYLPNFNFRGHSDTETIIELYALRGEHILTEMVGMWAFGIWDRTRKQLFVSRDRYGQKPLYVAKKEGALLFSSEIRPLLRFGVSANHNALALSEYLGLGNYGHLFEQTFFSEIQQILPAYQNLYDADGKLLKSHEFWKIKEVDYNDRLPFDEVRRKEFRELVVEAVKSQLLSDVQVGATLSGGLDSSVIVSCLAELGLKKVPIFTAQYEGTRHDETRYVKAMERRFGSALDVIYTKPEKLSIKQDLARVVGEQEEPFGDPSIMAHGVLVDAARRNNVPVLLGGQGGDEISMGYSWMYQRSFAYSLHAGDYASFFKFVSQSGSYKNNLRLLVAGLTPAFEKRLRMKARLKAKQNLHPSLRLASPTASFGEMSRLTGIYQESVKSVGIPHLCHYDDRSTMSRSIEGRMPFLDHRLMDFVSMLRPDAFFFNGLSKSIFRQAFSDILPAEIINRKDKVGFFTPVVDLIYNDLDWCENQINRECTLNLITTNTKSTILAALKNKKLDSDLATFIFRCISLNVWADQNSKHS